MENSKVLSFPVNATGSCDFDLMHNLLRYVYTARKNILMMNHSDTQEKNSLQHTYYCRAALKRRLKQIAMYEHELQD